MSDVATHLPAAPVDDILNLPDQEHAAGLPQEVAGATSMPAASAAVLNLDGLTIAEEELKIDEKASSMDFPPPPPESGNPYRVALRQSQKGLTAKVLAEQAETTLNLADYIAAVKAGQNPGKLVFANANMELEILSDKNGVAPPADRKVGKIFDQATTVAFGGTNRAYDLLVNILRGSIERPWTHLRIIAALWAKLASEPQVKVTLQWRAYCKNCSVPGKAVEVVGETRFPQLSDGSHRSTVPCTKCGADLQAQARATKYMPL